MALVKNTGISFPSGFVYYNEAQSKCQLIILQCFIPLQALEIIICGFELKLHPLKVQCNLGHGWNLSKTIFRHLIRLDYYNETQSTWQCKQFKALHPTGGGGGGGSLVGTIPRVELKTQLRYNISLGYRWHLSGQSMGLGQLLWHTRTEKLCFSFNQVTFINNDFSLKRITNYVRSSLASWYIKITDGEVCVNVI